MRTHRRHIKYIWDGKKKYGKIVGFDKKNDYYIINPLVSDCYYLNHFAKKEDILEFIIDKKEIKRIKEMCKVFIDEAISKSTYREVYLNGKCYKGTYNDVAQKLLDLDLSLSTRKNRVIKNLYKEIEGDCE